MSGLEGTRATSPKQYDLADLQWEKEANLDSPRTFFFYEYLKNYIPKWSGKRVFEIGSGSGWLLRIAQEAGATKVSGIEPSNKGVSLAREKYPEIGIEQTSFEDFEPKDSEYDVVVSVMVFSHIKNVTEAFQKVRQLLAPGGELIVVIPDFEYFRLQRKDYKITVEAIDEEQYIAEITRPSGTIADIVRTNSYYITRAKEVGFNLVEEVAMKPTEEYLSRSPKFALSKDLAMSQLLRFTRN